jgi:hypothetical protein
MIQSRIIFINCVTPSIMTHKHMYKPLLIAHRGLTHGPNAQLENHPSQIMHCLNSGYDVEIDLRVVNQMWMLGHDQADHSVDVEFILQPGLWIHAKDHSAAFALRGLAVAHPELNYFWHEDDQRTLTSQGYWWSSAQYPIHTTSVAVMPEWQMGADQIAQCVHWQCAGVCSDYVAAIK